MNVTAAGFNFNTTQFAFTTQAVTNKSESTSFYLNNAEVVVSIALYSIFGLIGFLENLIVIFVILFGDRFLDAPSNIFLLSLAVADCLLCAIATPLYVYNFFEWIYDMVLAIGRFLSVPSLGSLFFLSLDRFLSVVFSLKYHTVMTVARSLTMVAILWPCSIVFTVITLISSDSGSGIEWLSDIFRFSFVLIILFTVAMYIFMYNKSRKHMQMIRKQRQYVTGQVKSLQQDLCSLKTLLKVAGTFVFCWLPLTLPFLVANRSENPRLYYRLINYTGPFLIINSAIDPLIYFYCSELFRREVDRLKRRYFNPRLDLPVRGHTATVSIYR